MHQIMLYPCHLPQGESDSGSNQSLEAGSEALL